MNNLAAFLMLVDLGGEEKKKNPTNGSVYQSGDNPKIHQYQKYMQGIKCSPLRSFTTTTRSNVYQICIFKGT